MKKKVILTRVFKFCLAWLLSLIILVPMAVVFLNTLKTGPEASEFSLALPKSFQWQNYPTVIEESNLGRAFINSLITSLPPSIVSTALAAMVAFVVARKKTKFNTVIYYLFFFGLIAPINYVPIVALFKWLHLTGTFQGLIILWSASCMPFTVFLYHGFIDSVGKEIDEAAVLDGCGSFQLFWRIIFPLLKPVTVTAFLLSFITCWNDFRGPLYLLNNSKKWGMILAMYGYFAEKQSRWDLACTVIVLALLPTLIIYIFGQKYITAGMTSGAVKE